MRKTRSKYNQPTVKEAEPLNQEMEGSSPSYVPQKRGRRKPQREEEKSTIPFHGEEISSTAEKVNISNETDVKNVISAKKTQKTSPKQAKARKLPQNSKKEFSKSNFSMNKILQTSSPKEELKGKN